MNRILMVEEEENIVKTLQERLSPAGFEIYSAHDGRQGLQIAKDKRPDLIITDALIPLMSGFELCKAIKLDEDTKGIPIIVLTEKNRMEESFMFLGIKDFLNKPINIDALETAVKNKLHWYKLMRYQQTKILVSGKSDILSSCQNLLEKIPQWSAHYSYDHDSLLQDAAKYAPDVILIDLLMPEVSADAMIKKLKEIPYLNNAVFLTYYASNQTARDQISLRVQMIEVQYMKNEAEQAGAKEYLGPFNPKFFLDLINVYRNDNKA